MRRTLGLTVLVLAAASLTDGAAAAPDATAARARGVPAARAPRTEPLHVYPAVTGAIESSGWADVLVGLRPAVAATAPLSVLSQANTSTQELVLGQLGPSDFRLKEQYPYFPVIAGKVSATGLAKLRSDPLVLSVDEDAWLYPASLPASLPMLAQSVPSVGADQVHLLGVKGQGIGVAVVDTGIDNEHPDLAPAIVDQVCFSSDTRSCAPGGLPRSDSAQDEHGHGTGVSGIVLGRGVAAPVGVAPEAKLIGVRVFRDEGGAPTSDIVSGLAWIVGKQSAHNIRVVNMSLGGGASLGANCDDQYSSVKQVFQSLVSRNVAIFVATGNGGNTDRVAFPACISNSSGIGSTWDDDLTLTAPDCHGNRNVGPRDITCYTDRGPAMDLVAPGSVIVTPRLGGGATNGGHGTSYASPHAAGVAALVFSADPSIHARDIERVLQRTGDVVVHPERGNEVMRVNALKAVMSVLPATPTPSRTPTGQATAPPDTDTPTATATESPTDPWIIPSPSPTGTSEAGETPSGGSTILLPSVRYDRRR